MPLFFFVKIFNEFCSVTYYTHTNITNWILFIIRSNCVTIIVYKGLVECTQMNVVQVLAIDYAHI